MSWLGFCRDSQLACDSYKSRGGTQELLIVILSGTPPTQFGLYAPFLLTLLTVVRLVFCKRPYSLPRVLHRAVFNFLILLGKIMYNYFVSSWATALITICV